MPIQILDENTINKISAGEVVERPLNVVKELVENALDAKATTISVEIEKSGKKLISVCDNGCGMNKDDLQMSVCRHATSKITNFDDLSNIFSLGFRGSDESHISYPTPATNLPDLLGHAALILTYLLQQGQKLGKDLITINLVDRKIGKPLMFSQSDSLKVNTS